MVFIVKRCYDFRDYIKVKLSIIIPAYNSEATIVELLDRIEKLKIKEIKKEVIVVDDGSKDDTFSIIKKRRGIRVYQHKKNKGKGSAVKTGLENSTGQILFLLDADLEYDPDEIPILIKPIIEKKTEVVFSSRRMNKNNLYSSRLYKWGGAFVDTIISVALGANISDASSGSKAFTRNVYDKIKPIQAKGFDGEAEITAKIIRSGIKPLEQSISYYPRTHKQGKNIRWYHTFFILRSLIKYSFISKRKI